MVSVKGMVICSFSSVEIIIETDEEMVANSHGDIGRRTLGFVSPAGQ